MPNNATKLPFIVVYTKQNANFIFGN